MAGERTLPGLGLTGFWDLGDNTFKSGMDTNLRLLSALVQPQVLSVLAAEPGSPTDGDIHLASAVWGGAAIHDIVIRDNGAWVSITPQEGWSVYNRATDERLTFDGTAWNLPATAHNPFLGTYIDVAALTSAHATAQAGDYAHVDAGVASDVLLYIWDNDDTAWVKADASVAGGGLSLIVDAGTDRVISDSDLAGDIIIERSNASAQTVTVNTGLTGTEPVTIINTGGGALTFQGTATIHSAGGAVAVNTQYVSATLIPKGSDVYYLVGGLE